MPRRRRLVTGSISHQRLYLHFQICRAEKVLNGQEEANVNVDVSP